MVIVLDKIKKYGVLLILTLLLLTGCSDEKDEKSGKPLVYASFYPVYDIVSSVAEDTIDLRSFMPRDKDPHLWEPTPRDMKKLSEADLLIVNGANMEKWLGKVSESLPDLKILKLSDSIELITYTGAAAIGDFQYMADLNLKKDNYSIEFGHTHEDIVRVAFFNDKNNLSREKLIDKGKKIMEEKSKLVKQKSTIDVKSEEVYGIEMGHESGFVNYKIPNKGRWIFYSDRLSEQILPYELLDSKEDVLERDVLLEGSTSSLDNITYDPHSWLSLVNAKRYVKDIEEALGELYPNHKRKYAKNRLNTIEEMTDLEYEYKEKFKDVRLREFVVTHYAYEYLARDFELRQFPLQALTSMESPSLKTIKKALDFCQYYNIDTIFYEEGVDKKNADTIASDLGGESLPLVSMEYVSFKEGDSESKYIDFMRKNLENIYESLR